MNLGEFIEELKKFPQSSKIIVKYGDLNYYLKIMKYYDEDYTESYYEWLMH